MFTALKKLTNPIFGQILIVETTLIQLTTLKRKVTFQFLLHPWKFYFNNPTMLYC